MHIKQRSFNSGKGYTKDFYKIRDFIIRINGKNLKYPNFDWGRWEWVHKDLCFDKTDLLPSIGIWEDDGDIVAVATFEDDMGQAFFLNDEKYSHLKEEMMEYAIKKLSTDGKLKAMIDDNDYQLQRIARLFGLRPTQSKEMDSVLDISDSLSYGLPEGFTISSAEDEIDLNKLNRVMWRGFNHEGEPPEDYLVFRQRSISGPHQEKSLIIKTIAPNGDYASYCGMWYEPGTDYALVEPVCTDPDYRKMGLGKAAVLEGIIRCAKLGAKYAFVGSSQQFYYNIGFRPAASGTWWEKA